ncbi:hypothetical protein BVX98_05705 [bacterium F11]|nr:hypothetical protein BVX98_05705 [bacterium F11]
MKRILSFIFFLTTPLSSFGAGSTTGRILLLSGEARGAGMAEAYSAASSGVNGLWYNPATLSRTPWSTLSLMHTAFLDDISFDAFGTAVPFGNKHAIGFGVRHLRVGSISSFDNTGASAPSFSPQDTVLSFAYAKTFNKTSIGLAGKYINATIDDTATTFTGDAGIHQEIGPFSFGLSAENFGGSLTFQNEASPLPKRVRTGISWNLNRFWLINADTFYPLEEEGWVAAGTEYVIPIGKMMGFALRGGYTTRNAGEIDGLQGISAGMGLSINDTIIHYAWVPFGELGATHRISLNLRPQFFGMKKIDDLEILGTEGMIQKKVPNLSKIGLEAASMPLSPWKKSHFQKRLSDENLMDLFSEEVICPKQGPHSKVIRTHRSVTYLPYPELKKRKPLRKGHYLFDKDQIFIEKRSYAHLVYANGTKMEVGPKSTLAFKWGDDVCWITNTRLDKGELYTIVPLRKELTVETPFGVISLKGSESHLLLSETFMTLRILQGNATFSRLGEIFDVEEGQTLNIGEEFKMTIFPEAQKKEQAGQFSKKRKKRISSLKALPLPRRWDPSVIERYKDYIEYLKSDDGLEVSEYIRGKVLRDELKEHIGDLIPIRENLNGQIQDFKSDIKNFEETRKNLIEEIEKISPEDSKGQLNELAQVEMFLKEVKKSLIQIQRKLRRYVHDLRFSQNFLANIPIVRMLNITSKESTIPFGTAKVAIPVESFPVLDRISHVAIDLKPTRIVVEGHTDKTGSPRVNKRLSQQRAEAVLQYLWKKTGLPKNLFLARGMGSSKPLEEGDTPEILAKNRRVEIWFELRGL